MIRRNVTSMIRRIPYAAAACAALILSAAFSSCGSAIFTGKDYAPNAAPAIAGFTAVNIDGSAIDAGKIAAKRVYLLTVTASDPDGQNLFYAFYSPYGTFRDPAAIPGGYTIKFVVGVVKAGDAVSVKSVVKDSRGAVTGMSLHLGTGKLGPSISAVVDRDHIPSTGDVAVSMTSNCAGRFQLVPLAAGAGAGTAPSAIDYSRFVMVCGADSGSAAAALTGPRSSTCGSAQLPDASGYTDSTFYNVWVVFADSLNQADAVPLTVYVDDQPPTVTATTPSDGQENMPTQFSLSVEFSEAMKNDQFLKESLSIGSSAAGMSAGTVTLRSYSDNGSSHTAVYAVTGLSKNTVYTATVSGATDLADNTMAGKSFSFMTTPTSSIAYFGNENSGGGVPVAAQSYDEGAEVTIAGNTGKLTRPGYTFAGWNTKSDGTGSNYAPGTKVAMPADDLVLYAKWAVTAITAYSLKYNGASYSGTITGTSIVVTLPQGASRTNLVAAFSLTGAGSVTVDGAAQASGVTPNDFSANRVYRVWSADGLSYVDYTVCVHITSSYMVRFKANGGTLKQGFGDTQVFTTGVPAYLAACPFERTGYVFAGWAPFADGQAAYQDQDSYTIGTSDVTLYATWSPIAVSGVSLNKTQIGFTQVSGSCTLVATINPADAFDKSIIWSSNNTSVATVDSEGKVSPVATGTATITVTTDDGNKTAECLVTVGGQTFGVPDVSGLSTSCASASDYPITFTWTIPQDSFFDHARVSYTTGTGTAGGSEDVGKGTDTCTLHAGVANERYEITISAVDAGGVAYSSTNLYALSSSSSKTFTLVYDRDGLDQIRTNTLAGTSGCYLLMDDINLAGAEWTPLSTASPGKQFKSTINGNDHCIRNMKIENSTNSYRSFLGYVNGASIHNLKVLDAVVSGSGIDYGILASHLLSSYTYYCGVSGSVSSTNTSDVSYGGFVGNLEQGEVKYCYADCAVTLAEPPSIDDSFKVKGGGFVGRLQGPVSCCYSRGSVTGGRYCGGFAGYVTSNSFTVGSCYSSSTASTSAGSASTTLIDGYGFVGYKGSATISKCYYVNGTDSYATKFTSAVLGSLSGSWDFANIWNIDSSVNGDYPYLIHNRP